MQEELAKNIEDFSTSEYVTFFTGEECFAVEMDFVQEIIRVPEVVKVPKSPPCLMGLANLRGEILPVVSLREIFELPHKELDEASRVIVVHVGQKIGFFVDRVLSVMMKESSCIDSSTDIKSIAKSEFLKGVIRENADSRIIMILDIERIIKSQFPDEIFGKQNNLVDMGEEERGNEETDTTSEERQLVSFIVGDGDYAIDIDTIREIVQMPEKVTKVPNVKDHILGIMNLREKVLPLVNTRKIFNLEEKTLDESDRIVVLGMGASSVGLVVDSVKEVLRVQKNFIEPIPAVMFDEKNAEISEILKLEGGKRFVSIVSVTNLLSSKEIEEVSNNMEKTYAQDETSLNEKDEDEQMVVFTLDDEEYAVSIEAVQEVVRVPEDLTRVPKTPNFVEGVINLRGTVLPVVDLRRRLDLSGKDRNERQRIMVFTLSGSPVGFIVDSVKEVLKIPRSSIQNAPKLSQEQAKLLKRVANLEKEGRIIQLIEPNELLGEEEIENLKEERVEKGLGC